MEFMPSPGSPCAACKYLRRKCNTDCVYAPYFPPDHLQRFVNVHRVFGASNVAKILDKVRPDQRADAVQSLVYEADFRMHDPVHGCVGYISLLERKLQQAHTELSNARAELNKYQCRAVLGKKEQ